MIRANETAAACMSDEDAILDREQFVRNLGDLLSQTRESVRYCRLFDAGQPDEHVLLAYKSGCTRWINVYMDSYAEIIRDVMKGF